MATDASTDVSGNVKIAGVGTIDFRIIFPPSAKSKGPVCMIIGHGCCSTGGPAIATGLNEIFYAHGTNLTDANVTAAEQEIKVSISTGTVTFASKDTGDDFLFKIVGRGR